MQQDLIEKYKNIIKNYLSDKIRDGDISLTKAEEITKALAYQADSILEEHDIIRIIEDNSARFPELEDLAEIENLEENSRDSDELDSVVASIVASLIHEDINKSMEIMAFVNQGNITIEEFYLKYPEYKQ
jgi:hypothetical protein